MVNLKLRNAMQRMHGQFGLRGAPWWLLSLTTTLSSAVLAASLQIPQVRPVPDNGNLPLNSAMYANSMDYGNLATNGYVEREYFFSGKASTRDQESGAVEQADLPYTSRMVVRMPVNPKTFSGNVVIEPFHGVIEKTDMWMQTHPYLTRNGDVWVGFTVKAYGRDMEPNAGYALGGVPVLKAYDAQRYEPIHLEPDNRPIGKAPPAPTPPQALELVSQVAALFKTNDAGSPLQGMKVNKLYLMGTGINGEIIVNYVRNKMDEVARLPNGKPVIDGYLAGATHRFPPAPPKDAAFIMFRSENEMDRSAMFGFIGKNPDAASYRVYNVPGTAHLGMRNLPSNSAPYKQFNGVLPKPELNMPYVQNSEMCPNMNDEPVDLFLSAILSRLEQWGKSGLSLPIAPLPALVPGDAAAVMGNLTGAGEDNPKLKMATIKRDELTGNVIGGVRLPWVAAPVAQYPTMAPRPPGAPPPGPPLDVMHGGSGEGGPPPGAGGPPGMGGPPPGMMNRTPPTPVDAWPRETKDPPKLTYKPGGAPCFLFNPRLPYSREKLHQLYKNYDDYVNKFEQAKAAAVKAGYLLKEDAATLRPRGQPQDF